MKIEFAWMYYKMGAIVSIEDICAQIISMLNNESLVQVSRVSQIMQLLTIRPIQVRRQPYTDEWLYARVLENIDVPIKFMTPYPCELHKKYPNVLVYTQYDWRAGNIRTTNNGKETYYLTARPHAMDLERAKCYSLMCY